MFYDFHVFQTFFCLKPIITTVLYENFGDNQQGKKSIIITETFWLRFIDITKIQINNLIQKVNKTAFK